MTHELVAVMGTTPQVLTEALYALCVAQKTPVSRVTVITTGEGRRTILDNLLGPDDGKIHQLKNDYPEACSAIRFSEADVLVAGDGGQQPVDDINSPQDSRLFLELILRTLWEKSRQEESTLHVLQAGGRKTMSSYLALALQLLGRPQDRLYHVLVNPRQLEHHPGFFYPRPGENTITVAGQGMAVGKESINLIEMPYLRLRERLSLDSYHAPVTFDNLMSWAQRALDLSVTPLPLRLETETRCLIIGETRIPLQPQQFCLYWHFAERSKNRPTEIGVQEYSRYFQPSGSPLFDKTMEDSLLQKLVKIGDSEKRLRVFQQKVLQKGLSMEWVLSVKSRINSRIRAALPQAELLLWYEIGVEGARGYGHYGIRLDGDLITIDR